MSILPPPSTCRVGYLGQWWPWDGKKGKRRRNRRDNDEEEEKEIKKSIEERKWELGVRISIKTPSVYR
ncbi:MAG: hypothetical protein KAW17_02010 [Candidatus Eisenbacteria sp.]|nr:hypothetical protein [Candidatus Eisenbacteria bacterium]